MSSKLCCTAEDRPFSPALPCSRRIQLSNTALAGQESRFSTPKSEELHDLRRIFEYASTDDDGRSTLKSDGSASTSRTARIAKFLRRKLSRDKTKSKSSMGTKPRELEKLKADIRRNLLSDEHRDSGGYDADAPVLRDIDEIDLAELGVHRPRRGQARRGLQDVQWAATAPDRYCLSKTSLVPDTEPEIRALRHSLSAGSMCSWPVPSNLHALRLPSFAASTVSKGWTSTVMKSLHATSRSVSSRFSSEDVPEAWGNIDPKTEASSIYTPEVQSPRASPRHSSSHSEVHGSMDGSTNEPQRLQRAAALSEKHNAAGLMVSAIKQNREEKAALLLPGHRDQVNRIGVRERSRSISRTRTLSTVGEPNGLASMSYPTPESGQARSSRSALQVKPEFFTTVFAESPLSMPTERRMKSRALSVALDPTALAPGPSVARKQSITPVFQLNDVPADLPSAASVTTLPTPSTLHLEVAETAAAEDDFVHPVVNLGAWARYPSHTRDVRTGSAGPADNVKIRDFAYFPTATVIVESSCVEDTPTGKQKKRKTNKQKSRTGIQKSRSMMFAKEFIKSYARHIWAPNIEFLKHGHGHRTSISAGGNLEHPELEILPPMFAAKPVVDKSFGEAASSSVPTDDYDYDLEMQVLTPRQESMAHRASLASRRLSTNGSGFDGSMDENLLGFDAVRKARRSVSSPSLALSGVEFVHGQQSSQFWARMYDSCVELPRFSTSADQSVTHSLQHSRQVSLSASEPRSSADIQDITIRQYVPLLIDEILAKPTPFEQDHEPEPPPDTACMNEQAAPADDLVPLADGRSTSSLSLPARLGHTRKDSIMTMESVRASSMDLWKLLKETEEAERQKLMSLMLVGRLSVDVNGSD